ncbi:MAG: hypothetical protein ISS66_03425 [Desulfobacteraceae bacterium]|nr:hypothetical protein [Desulfobacteraceae bacterium]
MTVDKGGGGRYNVGGGVLSGVVIGIVLTFLYVKYDLTLPSWLQPVEKIKIFFITTTASLTADEHNLNELQREIAVKMKENPGYYTSIDNSLGKFITEEIVWRDRTKLTLKLLQDNVKNLDRLFGTRSNGLNRSIQRLLSALPQRTKEEKELSYEYLKRRFPDRSDTEIVEDLKRISLADLFQIPHPSARIVFALPALSSARIDIYDASKQKVKTLINAELPAGQYRLYWDFSNEDGRPLSTDADYIYKIYVNGKQKRARNMEVPKAIWN